MWIIEHLILKLMYKNPLAAVKPAEVIQRFREIGYGESRTHSGALFFMTTFAPWVFTSSKIFPARPLLNREIEGRDKGYFCFCFNGLKHNYEYGVFLDNRRLCEY